MRKKTFLTCEQKFLSSIAFSVNVVVRMACLSRSCFFSIGGRIKQTNYATDKPHERLR